MTENKCSQVLPKSGQARSILRQYHEISSRRYAGDYGACDVLIDFDIAVDKARLTRRQRREKGR